MTTDGFAGDDHWNAGLTPWALALAPVLAWFTVAAAGIWWPEGFYYVVAEDHIFEWVQVGGYVLTAGACLAMAVMLRQRNSSAAAAAVLGCALFVIVVGEELAWGQRLFGVSVPAVERVNQQGDLSLHNVGAGLTISQLGILGIALAGLLGRRAVKFLAERRGLSVPVAFLPPVFVVPWYGLAASYIVVRLLLLPSPPARVAKFSEVAELTVAVATAITALKLLGAVTRWRRVDGRSLTPLTRRS